MRSLRVELQAELSVGRTDLFALVATREGLRRWLDDANMDPVLGSPFRFRLGGSVAEGTVSALDAPQHVGLDWDWAGEPIGCPSVVSFDLIDHGHRTHLTLRHVGFRDHAQTELHDQVWRYWFGRLTAVATERGGTPR